MAAALTFVATGRELLLYKRFLGFEIPMIRATIQLMRRKQLKQQRRIVESRKRRTGSRSDSNEQQQSTPDRSSRCSIQASCFQRMSKVHVRCILPPPRTGHFRPRSERVETGALHGGSRGYQHPLCGCACFTRFTRGHRKCPVCFTFRCDPLRGQVRPRTSAAVYVFAPAVYVCICSCSTYRPRGVDRSYTATQQHHSDMSTKIPTYVCDNRQNRSWRWDEPTWSVGGTNRTARAWLPVPHLLPARE